MICLVTAEKDRLMGCKRRCARNCQNPQSAGLPFSTGTRAQRFPAGCLRNGSVCGFE